jgi:branched-chain amino acid transport system substrate-binding protein
LKLYQPEASNGIYGTVDSLPSVVEANNEWSDRYRKAFNLEPDYSAGEYYDGVMMIAAAIEKVGTDKDALVAELRTLTDHAGIGNTYTYAGGGDGGVSVAIVQIENGALKLVTTVK